MRRIKFVLWERYRAWWGARELNRQDPFLLDRLKADERIGSQKKLEEPKINNEEEKEEAEEKAEKEDWRKPLKREDGEDLTSWRKSQMEAMMTISPEVLDQNL